MDDRQFALIDQDGVVFYVAATYAEALAVAERVAPTADVWYDGGDEPEPDEVEAEVGALSMAANAKRRLSLVDAPPPPPPPSADFKMDADNAMKSLGLRSYSNSEIMAVKLEDAWEALKPMFPTRKIRDSLREIDICITKISGYSTADKMSRAFFGQNAKTVLGPRAGLPGSMAAGLSMLPAQSWRQERIAKIIARASEYGVVESLGLSASGGSGSRNMCYGSTDGCRKSCLVFSGQNFNDNYNTIKKYALTQALVHKPLAFLRMLYANIESHQKNAGRLAPFLRLNVYSDVPWEKLVPGMFEKFQKVRFYDYTKLAGRVPWNERTRTYEISNYDLTYSYGGTRFNLKRLNYEHETNHRRIAVTFALVGESRWFDLKTGKVVVIPKTPPYPGSKETKRKWAESAATAERRAREGKKAWITWEGLPKEFIGLKVIDGDQSDFRPYDPPFNIETGKYDLEPVVVGLRWKIPAGERVTIEQAGVFIVPGYLVEGKTFAIMDLPRYKKVFPKATKLPWEDAVIEEAD
jgi:hypothetical protein